MKTEICEKLGIEVPIFAFTHCRDVVVAVSKAGGLGVLRAVGFTPEQLKQELDWSDVLRVDVEHLTRIESHPNVREHDDRFSCP